MNAAMDLFWTHGFCDLGTRQIEQEAGITRFTLQTSFGGKMPLFLTVLDAYLDRFEQSEMLQTVTGGLEGVAVFFEVRGDAAAMPEIACQGCLMLNSMTEFAHREAEVNQRTERYLNMLRRGFQVGLERAKADGDVSGAFDVLGMAEVLLGAVLGLNAVIRAGDGAQAGVPMATSIAAMVRGWGGIANEENRKV